MPHFRKAPGGRNADFEGQAFKRAQSGETLLDRAIARAQSIVLGVRHRWRIVLVVALVVLADFGMQPRVLGLRLLFGEGIDGDLRDVLLRHLIPSWPGLARSIHDLLLEI